MRNIARAVRSSHVISVCLVEFVVVTRRAPVVAKSKTARFSARATASPRVVDSSPSTPIRARRERRRGVSASALPRPRVHALLLLVFRRLRAHHEQPPAPSHDPARLAQFLYRRSNLSRRASSSASVVASVPSSSEA